MSRIFSFDEIESTNEFLKDLIVKHRATKGDIVKADYQLKGKGQQGNTWHSEKGKNLLFSILIKPEIAPDKQFMLSKIISLAICDVLFESGIKARIKWPNDIYVGYKKLGGILIENFFTANSWDYAIAGIGLNINQENFPEDIPNPTSYKMITGNNADLNELLTAFSDAIAKRLQLLKPENFYQIDSEYENKLLFYKQIHQYKTAQGEISGTISKVYRDGRLEIILSDGTAQQYYFKEIEYIFY